MITFTGGLGRLLSRTVVPSEVLIISRRCIHSGRECSRNQHLQIQNTIAGKASNFQSVRRPFHLTSGLGLKNLRPTVVSVIKGSTNNNNESDTWHGRLISLLGAAFLISVAKIWSDDHPESPLKTLQQLFTVHAAKPINPEFKDNNNNCNCNCKYGGSGNGKGSKRRELNFIADVLEMVQDSVVCIEVKDHERPDWFGAPQSVSNGSGFIVKDDGLILTNAHVVASRKRCSLVVKLHDGRTLAGYVEDVDYESDLATVRVKARGLPTLQLGSSAETRVGEWVVAVGSPLNLSNSVTSGIVSNTQRRANELGIQANDINYIQTDAPITFGNSGGPLINLDGEAIGINSMKVTAGISFAIPIDHAKKFLEKAEHRRANGKAKSCRRYLGLTILTLTDEIRGELQTRTGNSVVNQGVFVWQVVVGGPAYLAGLQPADIVIEANGQPLQSAAQLHQLIKRDDKLKVTVQRGGSLKTVTIYPEVVSE